MKVYLCGPMRGKPLLNYEAFYGAADLIRAKGHTVFNPAEQDTIVYGIDCTLEEKALAVADVTVRELLAADLAWICAHAEALVVLPGWTKSAGGNAEVATAKALGIPVYALNYFLETQCIAGM